jgi:hypothetical protein
MKIKIAAKHVIYLLNLGTFRFIHCCNMVKRSNVRSQENCFEKRIPKEMPHPFKSIEYEEKGFPILIT